MILQALVEYYERKAAAGDSAAPQGFQWKELPYLIVIDLLGNFVRLEDTQEKVDKRLQAKSFLVPIAPVRAGRVIRSGLLWDQLEYAIGANPRKRDDVEAKFEAFCQRIRTELSSVVHPDLEALLRFLSHRPAQQIESKLGLDVWQPIAEKNPFVSFRVEGRRLVCEELFDQLPRPSEGLELREEPFCAVTGGHGPVSATHSKIKGVWNAQSAGASLVSFNLDSSESFGKKQNFNAPMSDRAADAYTKALNLLLNSDNRLQLGDASVVFWAQKENSVLERTVRSFFASPPKAKDDPDKGAADARQVLTAALSGIPPEENDTPFYILGLSPNVARISVRFWHQGSVSTFATRLLQHLADLEVVVPRFDQERLGLGYLLASTALEWKSENVPPNVAGQVMRAVLSGGPYPETLLQQCLRRIRAEREVNRPRAAILKACLNRKLRRSPITNEKEITVSLDTTNTSPGYRLGRLFAVLEKIQEDANPGLNATIRDRFYGAASSNPVAVFPQLLKLKNHHLAKLTNRGQAVNHEKLLGEVFGGLGTEMPAHLAMDDQARFAIGYYHQRQALFTKNETQEGDKK